MVEPMLALNVLAAAVAARLPEQQVIIAVVHFPSCPGMRSARASIVLQ